MTVRSKTAPVVSIEDARAQGWTCERVLFYAFGASYPDGSCHEGRLTDDDDDYITEDGPPCPLCRPKEYDEWIAEDETGHIFVCPLGNMS